MTKDKLLYGIPLCFCIIALVAMLTYEFAGVFKGHDRIGEVYESSTTRYSKAKVDVSAPLGSFAEIFDTWYESKPGLAVNVIHSITQDSIDYNILEVYYEEDFENNRLYTERNTGDYLVTLWLYDDTYVSQIRDLNNNVNTENTIIKNAKYIDFADNSVYVNRAKTSMQDMLNDFIDNWDDDYVMSYKDYEHFTLVRDYVSDTLLQTLPNNVAGSYVELYRNGGGISMKYVIEYEEDMKETYNFVINPTETTLEGPQLVSTANNQYAELYAKIGG